MYTPAKDGFLLNLLCSQTGPTEPNCNHIIILISSDQLNIIIDINLIKHDNLFHKVLKGWRKRLNTLKEWHRNVEYMHCWQKLTLRGRLRWIFFVMYCFGWRNLKTWPNDIIYFYLKNSIKCWVSRNMFFNDVIHEDNIV